MVTIKEQSKGCSPVAPVKLCQETKKNIIEHNILCSMYKSLAYQQVRIDSESIMTREGNHVNMKNFLSKDDKLDRHVDKLLRKRLRNRTLIDIIEKQYLSQNHNTVKINAQSFFNRRNLNYLTDTISSDFMLKLVEDCILLYRMCIRKVKGMRPPAIVLEALITFVKLRIGNKSLMGSVFDMMKVKIDSIFASQITLEFDDPNVNPQEREYIDFERIITVDLQSFGDHLESARETMRTYENITSSPFFKKIYECMLYAMSLSLFDKVGLTLDKIGYATMEAATLKQKFFKKGNFVQMLMSTILFICERGYQVYKTGDIMTMFHSATNYQGVFEDVQEIKRKAELLANPEAHGFEEHAFLALLDKTIEKLTSINKHAIRLDVNEKRLVLFTLNDMTMLRDDLTTLAAAREMRQSPFCLLIAGDSGIGKTTIVEMIFQYYGKLFKLCTDSQYKYVRNSAAKFWDGFVTSMWAVVLDDVAAINPDMKNMDSVNEIIQVANSTPFCPDQASLENKGRTPLKAKLCIATTNNVDLDAFSLFNHPSAIQRRFPFIITPKIKPDFKNELNMLDSSKIPGGIAFPNVWTYTIQEVVPVPIGRKKRLAEKRIVNFNGMIMEDVDQVTFFQWLKHASLVHRENQGKVVKCVELMRNTELCQVCDLPSTMCICDNVVVSAQSKEMYAVAAVSTVALAYVAYNSPLYSLYSDLYDDYLIYVKYRDMPAKILKTIMKQVKKYSTPERWRTMGEKVMLQFKTPKFLIALGIALTASLLVYKTTQVLAPSIISGQGRSAEVGTRPIAELDGRENVWYNSSVCLTSADMTRASSSIKGMEFTQFTKRIAENTILIEMKASPEGKLKGGRALCLGGQTYITNHHNIPKFDVMMDAWITQTPVQPGVSSNMHAVISETDIIRMEAMDMAVITLKTMPPKKDITKFFAKNSFESISPGAYVIRNSDGTVSYRHIKRIVSAGVLNVQDPKQDFKFTNKIFKSDMVDSTMVAGDCGSPLIVNTQIGYAILGIHIAFENNQAMATAITQEFIQEVMKTVGPSMIKPGSLEFVSAQGYQRKIGDLHKKSVFRYIEDGRIEVFGSFTDFRGAHKSSVEVTPMSYKLPMYKIRVAKPVMSGWVPWHIAAKELTHPTSKLCGSALAECAQQYFISVLNCPTVYDRIKEMVIIMDDFTAINGAPVAFIDKMNRNTSAGNPFKKCKKYFMVSIPPIHDMQNPVEVDPLIMDRVGEMIDVYETGNRVNPIFCAHLKDEPVSFKKAKIGKTRVFAGAPFDWCVVVRKYFMGIVRLIQNERMAFESGPGTIVQSLEWDDLFHHITKYGEDRVIAGDYKAFDKGMSPVEILLAFDVLINIAKMSGNYTDKDLLVMRGIAMDTAFAIVDFNGDLVQLFGSNPSGNPLTVILNGIVNSIRMRYAYKGLNPHNIVMDFNDKVSLMTYGDDNIMSVSETTPWFNHTAIAEFFGYHDIVYTMAEKEAESVPYIHISEASFLKRKWRFDVELDCHVAPLDESSIEKSLMVWNRSKSITPEAQGMEIISDALREYWYYGREVYEEKYILFEDLVTKLEWSFWIQPNHFLSYDAIKDMFFKSSYKNRSKQ